MYMGRGISFASVSTIFRLDFVTVPTVMDFVSPLDNTDHTQTAEYFDAIL
jgi:hypothetical protein